MRAKSSFTTRLIAEDEDKKHRVMATVAGADPGYDETAKMAAETAIGLVLQQRALRGGVLTPALAGGCMLIERLRRADMTFEVDYT